MMDYAQYSSLARKDIDSAGAYIADHNSDAARRFLRSVQDTVNLLMEFPALGAIYPHPDYSDLRAKLVAKFRNYIIFYSVRDGQIYVVRVLHSARDIPSVLEQ